MAVFGARRRTDDFVSPVHIYEPYVVGLPPLRPYLRALWSRRQFAFEMSRTTLRSQHFDTAFGQLWLVLNPLMLGVVYFLLVDILGRGRGNRGADFLAHLLGALFAYHFVSTSLSEGAKSVTRGGRLILNTAFPRLLLPIASVLTALQRFLPTLVVYAAVHVVAGVPIGFTLLWTIPILVLLTVFAAGVAMLFAVLQVYFRDMKSFLPYLLRVWLYLSPVLYHTNQVPVRLKHVISLNPLYPLLGAWSQALAGQRPSLVFLVEGTAWAAAAIVVGGLFFLSREREFAVRL